MFVVKEILKKFIKGENDLMNRWLPRCIWIFTIIIMGIGLLALYSASYSNVRVSQKIFYDQLFCAWVGVFIMFFLGRIDYRKYFDAAYVVYGVTIVFLLLVLFSGRYALGARRWFEIAGFSFQPSEVAKLALILVLGRYFSQRRPTLSFNFTSSLFEIWQDLLVPLFLTLLPMVLIYKQPDLGTSLLLFGIFIIVLFVSGIAYKIFFWFLALCCGLVPLGWYVLKPYQKDRLLVFLNPNIDPLGAGYTIIQSKIAVGSGKFLGKGWLAGTQNQLNFLPERHTDFIFSVLGEEWGLAGTIFLTLCFFVLIYCGLKIAQKINDRFGILMTVGIVSILTLQVVINIGMVLGLCPVVGLTLPFVSYGRTSFIVFTVMMGFLLNLSKRRTIF